MKKRVTLVQFQLNASRVVVQLVRTLACHVRGCGFKSRLFCHNFFVLVAQLVEHLIEDQSVVGSNPTGNTRECSRVG